MAKRTDGNQATTIHLPGVKAQSWNEFWRGKHYAARSRDKHAMALLVRAALDPAACEPYSVPVHVTVTATYKRHPIDCDNLCSKPLLDALQGLLLHNDSPRWVRAVTLQSRRGQDDSITIHLEPITEAN